jgi:LysR family glycine cleavage system transcriptional activator
VTHGAISKQIATIEDWVGRPLFQRNHKHMRPTEEATLLASAADQAWKLIGGAVSSMRVDAVVTPLRVIAPSTFVMRWLLPRVWSFSEQHEQIVVQLRQTDSLETWLDVPFDVAIRSDPTAPSDLTTTPFLREKLILAVSPKWAALQQLRSPADLNAHSVLSAATRPGQLEAWLRAAGLASMAAKVTVFPHFYVALEAALAGMGPLVCPLETLGDLLAKGELIEPWPQIRVTGPTYVAVYDPNSPRVRSAKRFVDWLSAARRSAVPAVLA